AKEIPALLRGKKVLIVGDDRQVNPTDAFIKQDDIERLQMNYLQDFPFPVHLLPGSSIYDLARVMFPDKFVMLKEHFRCVEPIIRFSMQFYNEPLIPLRIPTANERLDPPLIDIYVPDGQRTKGKKINPREADIIVDEIENLINDPSYSHTHGPHERPRTIGVISLIGGEQARYIQQRIIERIGEPKFIEHRILCGDSATMQGNERDIVFLSMVSGSEGRISSQTAEQYQRRFNVALSRARDRMILVRSVDENRLNPNDLKAKVIRHFQDPMPASTSPDVELIELCQSGFERAIFTRLSDRGYTVRPQVGSLGYSIDLVVEGSNGQRLAIECDGDLYHGPDRWADDMRRQRILERVGWVFWRVFGSAYSLDPDGVFEDLVQTLERLGIKPNEARPIAGRWTEHRVVSTAQESPLAEDEVAIASDPPSVVVPLLNEEKLELGDKIVLRYIDKPDSKPVSYVLTDKPSVPHAGLLNIHSPLAKQLAEIDVGDEFEFRIDASEQRILYVAKQSVGSMAAAAE
ncbi:MAG TPA: AAA domain-containing protein, partial [Lacipirellulaceae bacterium]|nr:AAA domain-containing protein [Lacipirellulaceae bacterium]